MNKLPLSVFIICYNEVDRITLVLESVKDIADEIIIVDSGSTDGTLEIIKEYTDKIFFKEWEGFGAQKTYAESLCKHDWILNLDADEILLDEIKKSIAKVFDIPNSERNASYSLDIRHVSLMSKSIKPNFFSPRNITPRLYNKNKAGFNNSTVHDKVINFDRSKPIKLKGAVAHISTKSFSHMWEKIRTYSELQAYKWVEDGRNVTYFQLIYDPFFFFIKNFFIRRLCFVGAEGLVMSFALSAGRALRIGMALELKNRKHRT
ncbi:glycosyltransferase family 2 protein [Nitrincola iocasae]|uniref:Glycosyltransferase family 2 protein n=1 Tax=Nitrincola iocasae TaxID=2614693 RepID=A0A5J6LHJ1_9GAMM|nr:glycosyltransferase family 2 protein [Nitrincola iocasae]QEW08097.1 glycosyltransferase family 2 protein [Nitrincola iocasae]